MPIKPIRTHYWLLECFFQNQVFFVLMFFSFCDWLRLTPCAHVKGSMT